MSTKKLNLRLSIAQLLLFCIASSCFAWLTSSSSSRGGRLIVLSSLSSQKNVNFIQQQQRHERRCQLFELHETNSKEEEESSSSSSSPSSLTDLLDVLDDERNVPVLQDWAIDQGVTLADGVKLVDNGLGDWGVGLSEKNTHKAKTAVMTVPQNLILSSNDPNLQYLRRPITKAMTTTVGTVSMEYFVPECLLIISVLLEMARGDNSLWKPWLDTLPKSFNTGLYLDQLERRNVERIAADFLLQQQLQFDSCFNATMELLQHNQLPEELQRFLLLKQEEEKIKDDGEGDDEEKDLKELIKWAFTVVFTRSWRNPSNEDAMLVPLGDMFNHDSEIANVVPDILQDGSVQMSLKRNVSEGSPLFLSYGMGTIPARFLVNFGFWDRSTLYMDANLTVPEEYQVDKAQLVVSTKNGGISQDVFNLAIYNVLRERDDQDLAKRFVKAQNNQDLTVLDEMITKFELEGAMFLRLHVLKILSETYPDMDIAPENLSESPRRFGMIARYNNGMRESWMKVGSYLMEEIEYILSQREEETPS